MRDGGFLVMPAHHRPSASAMIKTLSLTFDGRDPAIVGTVVIAFAVKAFLSYDKNAVQAEVERVYDLYAKPNAFERVPYVLAPAVKSVIEQQSDPEIAAQIAAVWLTPPTTRTSPSWHCSTATCNIQLSPGGTLTVTAVPAT